MTIRADVMPAIINRTWSQGCVIVESEKEKKANSNVSGAHR
jgi:hypothetical protein